MSRDYVRADLCQRVCHSGPSPAAGWEAWPAFDPRAFGARGDGIAADTAAIQAAIEAASAAGGGRVVLPAGTFVSASLFLKSKMALVLEQDAVLKASDDWRAYPSVRARYEGIERVGVAGLLNACGLHGVRISGKGTIDGSGFPWWNAFWARKGQLSKMDPRLRRLVEEDPGSPASRDLLERTGEPKPILIGACRDVLVEGIRIRDSASWTLHVLYSEEVEIRDVIIRNAQPHIHAPCTDGIDIDSCRTVHVHHCDIACHDDGICLKSGRGRDGARVNRPTENVLIHDCRVGEGHALVAMGTEFAGGIRNVVIRDCRSEGTLMGIRFKSNVGNGGVVENVTAENIACVKTRFPIGFRLRDAFGVREGKPEAAAYVSGPAGIPRFRNILLRNVKAVGAEACLGTVPYADETFDNVVLDQVSLEGETGLQVYNARNWDLRGVTRAACSSGPSFDVRNSTNILLPETGPVGASPAAESRGGKADSFYQDGTI